MKEFLIFKSGKFYFSDIYDEAKINNLLMPLIMVLSKVLQKKALIMNTDLKKQAAKHISDDCAGCCRPAPERERTGGIIICGPILISFTNGQEADAINPVTKGPATMA